MTYPVNEIFYSLQGEGFHTGTPATFVRLSGCNLKCDFCDTDHERFTTMSVEEIVAEVNRHNAPVVVITGGEPSLFNLEPLVEALHGCHRRVHVETNGTHPLTPGVDWVTCSPKRGADGRYRFDESVARSAHELKVVFTGNADDIEALVSLFPTSNRFLQPCSGENVGETIAYVLAHPWWRLSLQTHRLLGIQ